jgi:hypothetical protein
MKNKTTICDRGECSREQRRPEPNPFYQSASERLVRRGEYGGQHSASQTDDDHADLMAFEQAGLEALEGAEVQPW